MARPERRRHARRHDRRTAPSSARTRSSPDDIPPRTVAAGAPARDVRELGRMSEQTGPGPRRSRRRRVTTDHRRLRLHLLARDLLRRGPPRHDASAGPHPASLMRSPQVGRLLVANPYRWAPRILASPAPGPRCRLSRLRSRCGCTRRHGGGATTVSTRTASPSSTRSTTLSLREGAPAAASVDPVVLTANPLVAGFAPFEWARQTHFLRARRLAELAEPQRVLARLSRGLRAHRGVGRGVVAVSSQIIERIAPTGPHEVVPTGSSPRSGCAGVRRSRPGSRRSRTPAPSTSEPSIRDSTSTASRRSLARARPAHRAARTAARPSYISDLAAAANVHVHPSVGRAELVATLRNAISASSRTGARPHRGDEPAQALRVSRGRRARVCPSTFPRCATSATACCWSTRSLTSSTSFDARSRWGGRRRTTAVAFIGRTPGRPGTSASSRSHARDGSRRAGS